MDKKSDTLEQQRKARQSFLELKKMQAAAEQPAEKTRDIGPTTFAGKLKNFWYHYKAQTCLSLFLATALVICLAQCATKPRYDSTVILYTNDFYSSSQIDILTEYMKPYFTDLNGDGQVRLKILDCSYSKDSTFDSNYVTAYAQRLQATIVSEPEVQLFILDEKRLNELNELSESVGEFIIEAEPMPEGIYSLTTEEGYTMPENLIIGRRVLKGTVMENNDAAIAYQQTAAEVLQKIRLAQN